MLKGLANFPLYQNLLAAKAQKQKGFALLIDPDKLKTKELNETIERAVWAGVDYFFVGGSLLLNDALEEVVALLKSQTDIPVFLFPGSLRQISHNADALLLLSLISGRNPDLLIGQHVEAAAYLRKSPLEILPTGYMLIDGGKPTSVSYISNTQPIPANKEDIAICTALAGQLLGLKLIYMDAGSGALQPISSQMIEAVSSAIELPLIVGGGIRNAEKVAQNIQAGADLVVVGNALEKAPQLMAEMVAACH
ncbi:geranylgeranylglyceryl/heptaprenylglyceryl phosphate synthase [Saprospira grandis]|uniref:geranylgeranylglyceryl/heptaprenylglyceryl phosphate synthase n=1 Tax=Saprospira grandis TaxID=1008 RepID=UPI0022DE0301|nr:geranylgeranylglyceryl/heptaprenylglyceryl phosphate synthase [Saprospira grandis]WBM73487.1 geranylgeranylglyceryl/heptaprenylglyceryl phosphate synthase [Saprospira grandis]